MSASYLVVDFVTVATNPTHNVDTIVDTVEELNNKRPSDNEIFVLPRSTTAQPATSRCQ